MRLPTLYAFMCALLFAAPLGAQTADKSKETTAPVSKPPASPPLNGCGCYQDSNDVCQCTPKKSRCGCPGECEPKGCEDKRRKELEKEANQELKRQREEDKKRNAELSKKRDDEEKKEAEKSERNLRGLRLVEPK